jgi:inosose dehydratase
MFREVAAMKVTLGSAPDSWGVWFADDPKQTPWSRFLDEIAEAGYAWTELGPYAYLPIDPAVLRRELTRRGLGLSAGITIGALHTATAFDDLQPHMTEVCELSAALDSPFLVLIGASYRDGFTGKQLSPASLDPESWKRLTDTANRLGRQAKERFGLRLVFHPHADTHVEYTEQTEAFLEGTDSDYVNLCFDVGHHEYRGGDSVAFMRTHHERVPYLHLKSVDPAIREHVLATNPPFGDAVAMSMFVEPAKGSVDFPALAEVLKEIEYEGWGIVEQDMYPCDFDRPLPIAKRSYEYLKSLGLG